MSTKHPLPEQCHRLGVWIRTRGLEITIEASDEQLLKRTVEQTLRDLDDPEAEVWAMFEAHPGPERLQ